MQVVWRDKEGLVSTIRFVTPGREGGGVEM
eukprot:COSAG05_NODE_15468_length_369_cov_0.566667_1_plen_30_part_01